MLVDVALVLALRPVVAQCIVTITVISLTAVQTEVAFRWGAFDWGFTTRKGYEERRMITNCAAPPCAVSMTSALAALYVYLFTFLLDFHWTRGFANDVRGSVVLAQVVAEALANSAGNIFEWKTSSKHYSKDLSKGSPIPLEPEKSFEDLAK